MARHRGRAHMRPLARHNASQHGHRDARGDNKIGNHHATRDEVGPERFQRKRPTEEMTHRVHGRHGERHDLQTARGLVKYVRRQLASRPPLSGLNGGSGGRRNGTNQLRLCHDRILVPSGSVRCGHVRRAIRPDRPLAYLARKASRTRSALKRVPASPSEA